MKNDPYWLPMYEREAAKAYFRQYFDLKREYLALDGKKGVSYEGDPGGSGVSDPTMKIAEKRLRIGRKIEKMERACKWASPTCWVWILMYVGDPKTDFKMLRQNGFPLTRSILYKLANKAYWKLSKMI